MKTEITSLYPHFKDLDVKINKTYKTINFKGQDIKIAEYLPIDEKIALIDIALQKSMYNGMVHPLQLKKYYELGLVYMYSDIVFSEEDRADEAKIYDELCASGLLDEIIKRIAPKEIQTCAEMLKKLCEENKTYKRSAVGFIETVIDLIDKKLPSFIDQFKTLSPEAVQMLSTLGISDINE